MNRKFDWNDISIIPAVISDIKSRKEIDPLYEGTKLPLMIAPMDTVIDSGNIDYFLNLGYEVCVPRGIENKNNMAFTSMGLDEVEKIISQNGILPSKLLIDVANGHSVRVYDMCKEILKSYPWVQLMAGNIANPYTYKMYAELNLDYIRVGIGGGAACTSSANAAIHYPYGSLIEECRIIKEENGYTTKIVADGGFKSYRDIITALAVGADYVMIGNIPSKSLESSSEFYFLQDDNYIMCDKNKSFSLFKEGYNVYKKYRGMSTKEVQKSWGKTNLTTSEGISFYNKVEYSMDTWTENFVDYLKSAMSYCNARNLKSFIGKASYRHMTENSYNRFNK